MTASQPGSSGPSRAADEGVRSTPRSRGERAWDCDAVDGRAGEDGQTWPDDELTGDRGWVGGRGDGASLLDDERTIQAVASFQRAALELIDAARAVLDVAEEVVREPAGVASIVVETLGAAVQAAGGGARRPGTPRAQGRPPGRPRPMAGAGETTGQTETTEGTETTAQAPDQATSEVTAPGGTVGRASMASRGARVDQAVPVEERLRGGPSVTSRRRPGVEHIRIS